jgi:hypothetical protein
MFLVDGPGMFFPPQGVRLDLLGTEEATGAA